MSKAKHTPGPWFAVDTGNEPPFITDGHGLEIPNTWANCQMKAAAPELVEALEASQQYLMAWLPEYPVGDPQRNRVMDQLNKNTLALAKAKGE